MALPTNPMSAIFLPVADLRAHRQVSQAGEAIAPAHRQEMHAHDETGEDCDVDVVFEESIDDSHQWVSST
jgi:hypothetical protein